LRMIPQISNLVPQHSKQIEANMLVPAESTDALFQRVAHFDDKQAFERIFNRSYRSLCLLSCRIVRNTELAEEIVDDVFYSFWKNRKTINISSSFTSYLLVSVRNRSLDCLRKMKNKKSTLLDSSADFPSNQIVADEQMAYEELSNRIDAAIQSLAPQCRLIFRMSREQELTYKEIAEHLKLSIKTVDTQMGRALKHLRSEIMR
jgi:RNA polymerase sigma-70 factor (ECF subfamily)